MRPRGGRTRRGSCFAYDLGSRDRGFQSYRMSGPRFSHRGDRSTEMGHGMHDAFANTSRGRMSQHWFSPQFTNPSVGSFAHPMSRY